MEMCITMSPVEPENFFCIRAKGYTLIPTQVYFKKGMCKLELALGKSKKTLDKRDKIKKRELDREAERAMKYKK